ncbi:20009_t:CDS:2 [Dentiscutata erythropus]|uniref:20009_t:CDS:1 n=1 Tax=Dentiscutata erythropus TaxID=1348616 RepID=A0A9N8VYM2_9GLOM|nr:20009_t:CDS:2 [Dentiscutata erythropus]
MSEEKIILNIGGIKYETLRSTLTSQPETLLGKMFQKHNEYIKNSFNENEYFFNRNGEAFYYIMEFYRTGKFLWPTENKELKVTHQQLKEELDYFQINKSRAYSSLASEAVKSTIDRFILSLEELVVKHYISFKNRIFLLIGSVSIVINHDQLDHSLIQFKECAYNILNKMEKRIENHLVKTFSGLELKWKCELSYTFTAYEITITFSSPIEKLLKYENKQAHPAFIQAPVSTSEEKIVLNVGGKKYETFQSILAVKPETLLGAMFQDRNKCMRHPVNGNEYFFDRNSEAFYYIMEFYRTGNLPWPTESEKVTCKQLEEELDYFQIPFNKSTVSCSFALETVKNKFNNLIIAFEELIIYCCKYLRNKIILEVRHDDIRIIGNDLVKKHYLQGHLLEKFCSTKLKHLNAYYILNNMEKQIGDHLVKIFSELDFKWVVNRAQDHLKIYITFSIDDVFDEILNDG